MSPLETMTLLTPAQSKLAVAISRLGYINPFQMERIELERQILGEQFTGAQAVWSLQLAAAAPDPNYRRISDLTAALVNDLVERLAGGAKASERELEIYSDAVLYHLFDVYRIELQEMIEAGDALSALETLSTVKPDAIISDLHMPLMDGRMFCRRVRADAQLAVIPFVILSAYIESDGSNNLSDTPADFCFSKQSSFSSLLPQLENLIARANSCSKL